MAAMAFRTWAPIKDHLNLVFADPTSSIFLKVQEQFQLKYPTRADYRFGGFVSPPSAADTAATPPRYTGDTVGLINSNDPGLANRKWSEDVDQRYWVPESLTALEDATYDNLKRGLGEAAAMHYEIKDTDRADNLAYATIEFLRGADSAGNEVVRYINIVIWCRK